MGHCASREEKEQKKKNRRIEDGLKKDQSMSLRTIKLLLLGWSQINSLVHFEQLSHAHQEADVSGAGESGKSTILKQMRSVVNHAVRSICGSISKRRFEVKTIS